MFWPLAAMLLASGAFVGVVLWRHRPTAPTPPGVDLDQLKGYGYIGALGMALLAVAVSVLGLVASPGVAEAVALFGFFVFVVYLTLAAVLVLARRRP